MKQIAVQTMIIEIEGASATMKPGNPWLRYAFVNTIFCLLHYNHDEFIYENNTWDYI